MNDICKAQYSNKSLGVYARSINLLDMEKHLTTNGISARNSYFSTVQVQYGKTKKYTGNNSYYPTFYKNQKGAGINTSNITQPNITKGNDPYEESQKIATTEPTTDSSCGQASSRGLTITQTYYNIIINNDNYGTASSVLASGSEYWVASRFVDTDPVFAEFGLRRANTNMTGHDMFWSYNDDQIGGYRLCPLVSLSSNLFTGAKNSSGAWNLK